LKRQCPNCEHEYIDLVKCPKCGVAGTVALGNSAQEPPASRPPRVGTRDLTPLCVPQKVEPCAGQDDGVKADAPDEVDEPEPAPARQPDPPADVPRARASRAGGSVSYRSVRALAVANIVSNVLMLFAVIGLAYMYISSVKDLHAETRQQVLQLTRDAAERADKKDKDSREELTAERREWKERLEQERERSTAGLEGVVRRVVRDEFDAARVAALPAVLNHHERKTIDRAVAPMVAGRKGKANRRLSDFYQTFAGKRASRQELYDKAEQVIPTLPAEQVKPFERVFDALMGKAEADD
jgi:hypothetical protein